MKLVWFAALMVLCCGVIVAQTNPDLEQGMKPYGSYQGGSLDQVSLSNGNLFFNAPLFSYGQRGELAYPLVLKYNNKNFSTFQVPCHTPHCIPQTYVVFGADTPNTRTSPGAAVTVGFQGSPGGTSYQVDTGQTYYGQPVLITLSSVKSPDGSLHQLVPTSNGSAVTDGSGWHADSYSRDSAGNKYSGSVEDPNGNQLSLTSTGWTDSLGRQIPAAPGPTTPASTPPASTASLGSCPALNYSFQPVTFAYTWNLPTVNGGTLPLVLCYTSVYVRTNIFGGTAGPHFFDLSKNFTMLQSVIFPDNRYWAFKYDAADPNNSASFAFADLLQVTLPTSGTLTYTWAWGGAAGCGSDIGSRSVTTRTVNANDGTGPHTWTYSGAVTDPLGNETVHTFGPIGGSNCTVYETQTRYYQGSHSTGTLLKTVQTDYQSTPNPYDPGNISGGGALTVANVLPTRVTTTLPNGLVSKVETDYDNALTYHGPLDGITTNVYNCDQDNVCQWQDQQTYPVTNYTGSYGKVLEKREYDWGQGAPGPLVRRTVTTYLWQTNSAYLNNNFLDLVASITVYDGLGNQVAKTTYGYDETALQSSGVATQHNGSPVNGNARGNLTSVNKWLNTTNSFVTSHSVWFDTGELQSSTDPLGHATTHLYDAAYAGAFSTKTCSPSTGGIAHCVSGTYDFNTGLLTSLTNENATTQASGNTPGDTAHTSTFTYDSFWRMTKAQSPPDPANSNAQAQTSFTYSLAGVSPITVNQQRSITNSLLDSFTANFDGVGRTVKTQHVTPGGTATVDTVYNALGNVASVSNPYYSTSDITYGITSYTYDGLGRSTQTTMQDGGISGISYTGNCVTTTDEAGKQRKTCTDALGRLTRVWEDPNGLNYETDYQYNTLDNLIRVDQKGSAPTDSSQWRTRIFTYDSLSRLLTAQNPESGLISYTYDNDNELLMKTSPAPNQTGTATQTISYCYDELHRVTKRDYSAHTYAPPACPITTPIVSYSYDSAANAKGKLSSMTDQAGTATYSYDVLGRSTSETRTIAGVSKSMGYAYHLGGSLSALTYPSGRVVNYAPDSAGQLLSAIDSNGTQYVSSTTHYATGAEYQRFLPNIYFRTDFNPRLQVSGFYSNNGTDTGIYVWKSYVYNTGGGNNGNVLSINNNKDTSRSQSFLYDALNRIASGWSTASTGSYSWGENYTIDAWGNLQMSPMAGKAHGGNFQLSGTVQNRPTGMAVDAAGNLTSYLGASYVFDPENRISTVAGTSYTYDGGGQRVLKSNSSTGAALKRYWSGGGNILAEGDSSGNLTAEYVYFGGQRVARIDLPANTVHYYLSDHLNSTSMVVSSTGTIEEESDYSSFGNEYVVTGPGANHFKFTGKERDSETGLDYFGARYYSNALGRFMTPDWAAKPIAVAYADFSDPQTLNLYGYVRNLPTTRYDADGHVQHQDDKKPLLPGMVPQPNVGEVVEVKAGVCLCVGDSFNAGPGEVHWNIEPLGAEIKSNLAGDVETKFNSKTSAGYTVGPVSGKVEGGGEISSKTGPSVPSGKATINGVGLKADSNGVSPVTEKTAQTKLGAEVSIGVKVGAAVNLSKIGEIYNALKTNVPIVVGAALNQLVPGAGTTMGIGQQPPAASSVEDVPRSMVGNPIP